MVLLRILADVADSQRRLDQRGAVMCLVLNGVIENKHVQSGGEVLQRDRFRLAVGEELVAAARANDDGAANRDIQLRRGSVYIRDYGAVRVFWGQHEGFGSHWCVRPFLCMYIRRPCGCRCVQYSILGGKAQGVRAIFLRQWIFSFLVGQGRVIPHPAGLAPCGAG